MTSQLHITQTSSHSHQNRLVQQTDESGHSESYYNQESLSFDNTLSSSLNQNQNETGNTERVIPNAAHLQQFLQLNHDSKEQQNYSILRLPHEAQQQQQQQHQFLQALLSAQRSKLSRQ